MNPLANSQKKRIALVIGNSNYGDGNDVSGVENATAMAKTLKQLGFTVLPPVLDANRATMDTAVTAFSEQIEDADVVLLFYSGHGVQLENKNYLIPKDGSVSPAGAILLDDVIQKLGMAPNEAVKLVFLDACRDDKRLPEDAPRGMTNPSPAPPGTLQAFSASPNQLAESGLPTETSVYTKALLSYLPVPGLELGELFAKVRTDVFRFSKTGQETFQAGTMPQKFFFRDPVFVRAVIPPRLFLKPLIVILNEKVALDTDQPTQQDLRLNAGENSLELLVANGKTFRNGFTWERTEGWSYQLDLELPNGSKVTFEDQEDHPFKAGPHHGGVFTVGRATLFVDSELFDDPQPPRVILQNMEDHLANRDAPVWAQDQDRLFESSITDLNLSPEDILGDAVPLGGLAAVLRPFLVEFLKTGKILGSKVADPDKTFATVWGNKALKSTVEICMTQGRADRIRDLKASIAAAFKRAPTPFGIFDDGLMACLRATAPSQGVLFKPEDIRIYTALEDRSRETPAADAPTPAPEASAPQKPSTGAGAFDAEALTAMAQDSILLPRPDELLVGPDPSQQFIQGVPVTAQIYTFVSLKPLEDHVQIHARVVADLSDLQSKIGALIDTIPLPTDNCSHFGIDNVVARIWGKQITVSGDVATLKLNGDVDVWTCVKNPVPCSRLEWDESRVLGVTIRTPRVVFFDCNPPIKNKNVNQPFEAMLPFTLGVVDARTFALKLGDPAVDLGGALGGVTEGILRIAGVDINAKVKEALDRVLSPNLLKQTLPERLLAYHPTLTRAEIVSNSGALALTLEMDSLLDAKELGELIQVLINRG